MNMRSSRTLPPYNSPTPRQKNTLPSPTPQHALEQPSPLTEKLTAVAHAPEPELDENNTQLLFAATTTQQLHRFIDNHAPYEENDDDDPMDAVEEEEEPEPIIYVHSDTPEVTPDATPEPELHAEDSLGSSQDDEEDEEEEEEDGVMQPQPLEESSEEDDDGMDESKSEGELEAIACEMEDLTFNIPCLAESYRLIGRLGEGTFSSVYKAIDLKHKEYNNVGWVDSGTAEESDRDSIPPSQASRGKVYVALKRIYVTSSPVRIFNELSILNDLRGASNVAFLISAIRHDDQVIAVMPFNRHQDFRSYYRQGTMPLLRSYFSSLFKALAATHTKAIIHRDVKPANFLYDVETGQGILCDFGLAQNIGGDEYYEWKAECCHSLPGPALGGLKGREKAKRRLEKLASGVAPGLSSGLHGARLIKPVSLWDQAAKQESEWVSLHRMLFDDPRATMRDREYAAQMTPWMIPDKYKEDMKNRNREKMSWYKNWRPATSVSLAGTGTGSTAGAGKKERVGYLKEDRRPGVRANRAGTRGFRAPEVLLKCPDQSVSIDIWSAGIILLCFLTRRFPFFNSNDDTEALVEIAAIFGRRKMEKCAALHNRTFITNITSLDVPPHETLHALVKSLNPPIVVENSPDPYGPIPSTPESDAEWYNGSDLYQAIDLMKRCLEMDLTRRWTAEECLDHPFFVGEYAPHGRSHP